MRVQISEFSPDAESQKLFRFKVNSLTPVGSGPGIFLSHLSARDNKSSGSAEEKFL